VKRPIPFSVVAPATILLFGAAVTLATLMIGLAELRTRAQETAQLRASALAKSLSERLASVPKGEHEKLVRDVAKISGSTIVVLDINGNPVLFAPKQPLSEKTRSTLNAGTGVLTINDHELSYAAAPIRAQSGRVVALSPERDLSESERSLVSSVVAFAALLLAAAGFVGWTLSRDVHLDVLFVRDRIAAMAQEGGPPQTQSIPVRTIDQVGQLTASFNVLLERFAAAERAYRQDLSQARNFDKDRASFLSALSHELRTPLNVILGFTDVLLDEIDGPLSEESRENLTIVRTSGEHLRSLIDDILALSALESGQFRLSREQLDIASVAQNVLTEARVTAKQKGLTIELAHSEDIEATTAYADRRRMRQILQNLVSNAVKFTTTGKISVRVYPQGDHVVASVTDTGPGIAAEELEAIFEEFQQADTKRTSRTGTGLGLSITRRLVQMHGGSIRVESELGKGSSFFVRIPKDDQISQRNINVLVTRQSDPIIREA
jgi:signal transduction histidine kinase